jgi:hypothetical protein
MWESRSDFQGAVGRVENLGLVFQAFHGPGISTALFPRRCLFLWLSAHPFSPWLSAC